MLAKLDLDTVCHDKFIEQPRFVHHVIAHASIHRKRRRYNLSSSQPAYTKNRRGQSASQGAFALVVWIGWGARLCGNIVMDTQADRSRTPAEAAHSDRKNGFDKPDIRLYNGRCPVG